ncbi:MFS transporter [Diaphorobacter sp. HDW4A]|uniref:MFS transporter n=1 Tax=Diaphorobacter sp. HDW4A TaxID=2714924 RepID=UPI00140BDD13|nr:MFS transporter [Diaphorobacter sp. HDW4A]QIL81028.1 MFS transporter [Diaphorobacter sp. HDW4A]
MPHDTHSANAPFHGHAVVRAAFVSGMLGWGIGFYGPPIFLYAVISATGWSVPLVSAAITLHYLFGAFVVSLLPRLHARFGVPRITLVGSCLASAGVIGWACAHQHWQLFASALLTGAGWVTMSAAGINAMIAPWFNRKRPMALSKAYNGASVGGMVFAPLWSVLIAQFGFPVAACIVGACTLVIMFWLTQRVLALTPAMLGQTPDGAPPDSASDSGATSAPANQNAVSQTPSLPGPSLWRSARFRTLAAAMSLSLFAQSGLVSHLYSLLVPMLGAQGAGWSMTLMTACAMLGRMLFARALATTHERRLLSCASYAMQMCGVLLLMTAGGPGIQLWCGLVLFGSGIGNTISLPPLIAQADFAAVDVARVVALIVAISQALYAFAPLTFSLLLRIEPAHLWLFAGALTLQALAILTLWSGRTRH